jgi:hypothetical protein
MTAGARRNALHICPTKAANPTLSQERPRTGSTDDDAPGTEHNARALPEHAAVEGQQGTATGYNVTDMCCVMYSSFVALLVWWDKQGRQVSPPVQEGQ